MKDLQKMAKNGYGHYLRRVIPWSENQLRQWKADLEDHKRKQEEIEYLIKRNTGVLEKDKAELKEIEEKYTHLEP